MKASWVFLFLMLSCAGVHAQTGAKTQSQLPGVWVNGDYGYQMTLMLNADGGGEFDGEPMRYVVQGDRLTITQQGQATVYNFELTANTLKVSGGDLEQAITFSRQGRAEVAPSNATKNSPSSGGHTIPKSLIGAWSGYDELIEFRSDGQCIYRGQPLKYAISGNRILISTDQGSLPFFYSVSGNELQLTVNGQMFTYTRTNTTTQSNSGVVKSRNAIDASMVGQWCYVNVYSTSSGGSSSQECITLRGDGTYVYSSESSRSVNTNDVAGGTSSQSSDRGTWWVQGDRVYYNSQHHGQGSYRLEKRNHPRNKDPMIVLDGRLMSRRR